MTPMNLPPWLPADPRKRRWLAVGLLVLVCGSIVAAIAVPAVLLHRHYDENIFKLDRQLRSQTAFNALRPRLTEKLELLKARDVKKLFLKGTSSALAQAELQEIVRATIEANGGRVNQSNSVQGNASKDEGGYRQVAAGFGLIVNNANLRRVLYTLETKEPYLFVDTIAVQPQVGQPFRPAQAAIEQEMFIQLEVRGFALRPASEVTASTAPQADAGVTATPNAVKGRRSIAATRGGGDAS